MKLWHWDRRTQKLWVSWVLVIGVIAGVIYLLRALNSRQGEFNVWASGLTQIGAIGPTPVYLNQGAILWLSAVVLFAISRSK